MRKIQVAEFFGRGNSWVSGLVKKGVLNPKKVGRNLIFDKEEVYRVALEYAENKKINIGNDADLIRKRLRVSILRNRKKLKPRYARPKFLEIYEGYDFLQYFGIVRQYITKKHHISLNELDLLLYLIPLNYFTKIDIDRFPKQFTFHSIQSLIKKQVIIKVVDAKQHKKNDIRTIYTVAKAKREIIEEFYQLLALETPFDLDSHAFIEGSAIDEKRKRFIRKVIQKADPKKFETLYKD